jgi:hypothetical protein
MSASTKSHTDRTTPVVAHLPSWLAATIARHRGLHRDGLHRSGLHRRGRLVHRPASGGMVLTTDARDRHVWADLGWPASDERLVRVTDWPTQAG